MKLVEILAKTKTQYAIKQDISGLENISIEDISIDSRLINHEKNTIFFALVGKNSDGKKFAASAIEKGAKVIVSNEFFDDKNIISIQVENPFIFLVECLKIFYNPLPANIYAVTGTNGKTSVAEFIRQILGLLGKKSASIGTLGVVCDEVIKSKLASSALTTPDIVSLYKNLAILKENNIDDVAIEVSSIGLEQARIAGLQISVAGFTNFTQDHLDYHKTMEEYFFSKMLLFEVVLKNGSPTVLNADSAEFVKIRRMCQNKKHHIFEYGFKAADLKITEIKQENNCQIATFECGGKKHKITLNVAGEFQVYNVLCALGMTMAKHYLDEEKFTQLLEKFSSLKTADGRMQKVAVLPNGAQVFIDFAHSPDALENVLKLVKNLEHHRVGVLFGCGGNRDATKRPLMGKIACTYADFVIVTDDNPRNEEASAIRKEILQGCDLTKTVEITDRKYAIEKALQMLQINDILILAGKGHEKYQIIGDKKSEFDEEKIVAEILNKLIQK